jgi:transposase-like protein
MAARRFFAQAISATEVTSMEVTTGQAPAYPAILDALLPAAWHRTEQYGNNRVEADHGRLKARLGPMRGLNRITAPGWSSRGMRWCRTFGVDITSWRSRSP